MTVQEAISHLPEEAQKIALDAYLASRETVLVHGLEMPADCCECGAELPVNDWDCADERDARYTNRCDNCGTKAVR